MAAPQLNIENVFSSPIVTSYLPDSGALNRDLTELFLAREREGERYRKKVKTPTLQIAIFESEFDLFSWPDRCVQVLREYCMRTLTYVVAQLNNYRQEDVTALRIYPDCWFHITRYGGYIAGHTHPMASWSGVYCVKPGEDVPDRPDSGILRFPDARSMSNMYLDPGNAYLERPFNSGSVNYKLEAGQLVLFPSYLTHEVGPFFGRDERITVAFNCSFKREGGAATEARK